MIAGTVYSAIGMVPWQVWPAAAPYGLLCTAVLMGKHIDKIPWDEAAGVRTLPVILGEPAARMVSRRLMVGFYVVVIACLIVGALPWPALAAFGAVPLLARALRALARRRPERPPRNFPIWPLWFATRSRSRTRAVPGRCSSPGSPSPRSSASAQRGSARRPPRARRQPQRLLRQPLLRPDPPSGDHRGRRPLRSVERVLHPRVTNVYALGPAANSSISPARRSSSPAATVRSAAGSAA